jgi:hypothetical protein
MFDKWRYGKWRYIGYTELSNKKEPDKTTSVVHFYIRDKNEKIRKAEKVPYDPFWTSWTWYNINIVPWLEGGDMWKPVCHPVAVKGTLINHLTQQPPSQPNNGTTP